MTTANPRVATRTATAVYLLGTLVGTVAFCIYKQSWQSGWMLAYDVPAALASYSFPALLLARAVGRLWRWSDAVRLGALLVLTVLTVGREFAHWPTSGHVTCVVAVAVIMAADPRLPKPLRAVYWVPVPIVAAVRVIALEHAVETGLVLGAVAGAVVGVVTLVLTRWLDR